MQLDSYIRGAETRLHEVEQAIASFDFSIGRDQRAYEKLNREYQRLSRLLQCWQQRCKTEEELEGARELLATEQDEEFLEVVTGEIADLEERFGRDEREIKALILPPHPNQERDIIVEIRPAAGGDEACLFVGDLYRMYMRFAEQNGWRVEHFDLSETDLGGIKYAAFSLQGADVFERMCRESGVHRVQRIPVTESGGRIHTSTVTVAVLPEAQDIEVEIDNDDLRFDVYRSQGPGGQSVNTTDSAVRVTHLPTGLVVTSQQEKSQHRNKDIAMRILRSRLLELRQAEEAAKSAAARRQQVGTGDRSERIRTYNFPQNRVSDHRFGVTLYDLSNIMEGNLAELLRDIAAVDAERCLAAELDSSASD